MQVQELTKKIYKDFPKVWEKMKNSLGYYQTALNNEDEINNKLDGLSLFFDIRGTIDLDLELGEYHHYAKIPFSMLYGLLEDFFEENGIIINITFDIEEQKYWVEIINDLFSEYCEPENLFGEKDDVKIFSILKACEILENKE